MVFPLESGTCRVVCRPNRSKPRKINTRAVVRFANAAVRDGEAPCDVVQAVVEELGCGPCEGLQEDTELALEVVQQVRAQLRDAVVDVLLSFGFSPDETMPKEDWFDRLIRRLRGLTNLIDTVDALITLVAVASEAVELLGGVGDTLAELARCIGEER